MRQNDQGRTYVPSLVFIETTKACEFACRHCRAESQSYASPDELTTGEVKDLLDQIRGLAGVPPEVVITGGDFLLRSDIREIISYLHSIGLEFSVSPAGSTLLTEDFMKFLLENKVKYMSLSLDGTQDNTHDWLRRIPGSFDLTLSLLMQAKRLGMNVQVNTTIIKRNLMELPTIASLTRDLGASAWEVFFLIKTGRGTIVAVISPSDYMQVIIWVADLRQYGLNVRTVEGPVFSVIKQMEKIQPSIMNGEISDQTTTTTRTLIRGPVPDTLPNSNGRPIGSSFRGTLFVGHNGDIYPSGLFTVKLGSLRKEVLKDIISKNIGFLDPRGSDVLVGKCGNCNFMEYCGGSRARAFNYTKKPFASDPACLYDPRLSLVEVPLRQ